MPGGGLLVGMGGAQQHRLLQYVGHQLQSNGQLLVKAAGQRERGQARHVGRNGAYVGQLHRQRIAGFFAQAEGHGGRGGRRQDVALRKGGGESSAAVRARVLRARARQQARAKALGLASYLNATLPSSALEKVAALDDESKKLLEGAVNRLGLSARAFNKVLRVGRTLADLDGEEHVRASHVGEAIQGRILDRADRR